jgi:hypothetical protein
MENASVGGVRRCSGMSFGSVGASLGDNAGTAIPFFAARSARRNAAASWKRSARFFCSAFSSTLSSGSEISGLKLLGGSGLSRTCWYATDTGLSPTKGGRPVSVSYSRQPAEYRSLRASTASPRACSGDRYWAVPTTAWVWVIVAEESATARAMPKSMTLTMSEFSQYITFAGLMSRCTIPALWLYSSADRTPSVYSTAWSMVMSLALIRSRRVLPATNSMTM